ncbi:MAG: helix-turn-helix domain-containing protein [Lachnospiraceae bacterium]
MDSKVFGQFIAETRKEKNMTQAELAGIIKVSDKTISRWERGVGFPDINTLEPLARALDITVFELIHSEKSNMKKENMPEGQMIEIMHKAVEMSKENHRQEQVSLWLGGIVTITIAILIKIFSKSSVSGALLVGGIAAVAVVSLYFYVRNFNDNQCRKIYGSFMLIGTLLSIVILQLAGMEPDKVVWLVYSMFFLSVVLMYKKMTFD